jgi:hypothetical protein
VSLPNQEGGVDDAVVALMIRQLAQELGIDPQYIRLDPESAQLRSRTLTGGTRLKFVVLANDAPALAATLAAITSSDTFWENLNAALANENITSLDTNGMDVQNDAISCNTNFRFNNVRELYNLERCACRNYAAAPTL